MNTTVTPRQQDDLRETVTKLALAIDTGDVTPQRRELEALAQACETQRLPSEARRVRRWLGQ